MTPSVFISSILSDTDRTRQLRRLRAFASLPVGVKSAVSAVNPPREFYELVHMATCPDMAMATGVSSTMKAELGKFAVILPWPPSGTSKAERRVAALMARSPGGVPMWPVGTPQDVIDRAVAYWEAHRESECPENEADEEVSS